VHELSIALSLIEAAEEEAARHSGRVQAIHLKLGPLSGVIKDALVPAFEMAAAESTLANVRLLIEETPIVVYCDRCQARRTIQLTEWFCCPECGTASQNVVGGRELEMVALEIVE
jgi:hydrogenase nickel incorporation protein HypA/HybF